MPYRLQSLRPPRVLVVDDEPIARTFIARKLKGMAEVSEASDGADAVQKLDTTTTDLIILDLEMPRVDGLELLRLLRSKPQYRHIPVIVITGVEDRETQKKPYLAGATSVLLKPVDWHVFGEHVRHLLELAFRSSHLALHDQLTGLPNRILFETCVNHFCETAEQDAVSILAMDLDGFKGVNDQHGHPVGDRLLIDVSRRLRALAPRASVTARIGGDEFLIAGRMSESEARHLAERIIEALSRPYPMRECDLSIGVTVGISTSQSLATTVEELKAQADQALYLGKERGKGVYEVYKVPECKKHLAAEAVRSRREYLECGENV